MKVNGKKALAAATALCVVLTSSPVFAKEGDYFRSGPTSGDKVYDIPTDKDKLIADVKAKASDDKFYKEVKDGKYVDPSEEQKKQREKLVALLAAAGVDLNDEQAVSEYFENADNDAAVEAALAEGTTETKKLELGEIASSLKVLSVSAINLNTIEVKFNKAVEELKKENVSVSNVKTLENLTIKSVKLAEDKKSAQVELYASMVNGEKYKVVANKSEKEFDFAIGNVATIEVEPVQVVKSATATPIKYKLLDANGLDVTEKEKAHVTFQNTLGTIANHEITLAKDKTSFVYVIYKAGTESEIMSSRMTIKAEDAKNTKLIEYSIKVGVGALNVADFEKEDFKPIKNVKKLDVTPKLYAYVEDQFGDKSVVNADFESVHKSIALVNKSTGAITALKQGNFDVKFKNGDIDKVLSLAVVEDAKAATLELDKVEGNAVTVSDQLTEEITVIVRDQYKDPAMGETVNAKVKTGTEILSLDKGSDTSDPDGKVSFTLQPKKGKEGTATVEFSVGDEIKLTLTVTVVKAGVVENYIIEGAESKLDANNPNPDNTPNKMTLKVFGVDKNGVKVGEALEYDNTHDYTVELKGKDKDGADIDTTGMVTKAGKDAEITADANKLGNFTAVVKIGSVAQPAIAFEVVDTEEKPQVVLALSEITADKNIGQNIRLLLQDALKVEFKGESHNVTLDKVAFVSDDDGVVASENTLNANAPTLKEGTVTIALKKVQIDVAAPVSWNDEQVDVNFVVTVKIVDKEQPKQSPSTTAALSDANKKLTITMTEDVEKAIGDAAFKAKIKIKKAAGEYAALADGDTVTVSDKTVVIDFAAAKEDGDNKVKIEEGALKDKANDPNLSVEVETVNF